MSSGWEIWMCRVAESGGGGVVLRAGALGGRVGDVESFADGAAEDLADDDGAEEEDYFEAL